MAISFYEFLSKLCTSPKLFVITSLVLGVIFASCSNETAKYTPTNEDISWELKSYSGLATSDETPYTFNIQRGVANKEANVAIAIFSYTIEKEVDSEGNLVDKKVGNNLFTLPVSAISFAAGEYKKSIDVAYSYASLEPGVDYYFDIEFSDEYAGPGCNNVVTGNVKVKLEYEDYASIVYSSRWFTYPAGVAQNFDESFVPEFNTVNVTLQRAKGTNNYYKLENLFYDRALEFKMEDGSIVIDKYSGYNDKVYSVSSSYVVFRTTISEGTLQMQFYPYRITISASAVDADGVTILPGTGNNYFTFNGWFYLNGSNWPSQYNCYHWLDIVAL